MFHEGNIGYLCNPNIEKWWKFQIYFLFPQNNAANKGSILLQLLSRWPMGWIEPVLAWWPFEDHYIDRRTSLLIVMNDLSVHDFSLIKSFLISFRLPFYQSLCPSSSTLKSADLLTHWGRVTHICVGILTSIGSDNGLSPGRRQAIIWTNAGMLLIEPLGTNLLNNNVLRTWFKRSNSEQECL